MQLVKKQKAIMKALAHNLSEVDSNEEDLSSQAYCEFKIQAISNYWADISANNSQIWSMAEDEEPFGYQFSYYLELEKWVHETLIHLRHGLGSSSQDRATKTSQVKLPKVTLPIFNGDYLKWSQFRELYLQMIHSQPLSNSEKMYYLSGSLVGEAKALIQHLIVSEQNYDIAWQILEGRYNNKRLIVNAILNKLLSQPSIAAESAHAIKSLHDVTKECILGVKNLGIGTDSWDALLLHLILKKVDKATHALYEQSLQSPREIQSFNKFLEFLELRFQSLEALGTSKRHQPVERKQGFKSSALVTTNAPKRTCKLCKQGHALYACPRFLKLSPAERQQQVVRLQVCSNCLREGHNSSKCTSRGCLKCQAKHNSLLHIESANHNLSASKVAQPANVSETQISRNCSTATNLAAQMKEESPTSYVFLGTALVYVKDKDGNYVTCRAILDSGSQLNFMTERLCKLLRLPLIKSDLNISGIGNCNLKSNIKINITMASMHTGYTNSLEAFVINEIAGEQPQRFIGVHSWPIPNNIKLADPAFNQPQKVDLLIGAELYPELLSSGQIKLHEELPSLQNTVLGWVVLGRVCNTSSPEAFCGISHISTNIDDQLQRFWEVEEIQAPSQSITYAERACEAFFERTVKRNGSGRFVVKLPFKEEIENLGNSRDLALRRFLSLERKLMRHPELKMQYVSFMDEYLKLNHMEPMKELELTGPHYFIPHHCVLKPDSSTTKLRVVFDASAKTVNGVSLNDILFKGPVLQDDLFSILLRFRMHKYVMTGDIEKMYRQVLLNESDRNFQLIFWRDKPEKRLQIFRLNTVTYGTTPAPYLATKCLQSLAAQEENRYPLGAKTVMNDFYVDDLMSGSNNLKEALEIQRQTKKLLASAGFHLRKWCANHPKLLENIPKEDIELELDLKDAERQTKTLGLTWKPAVDEFGLRISSTEAKRITKRTILAEIAQLFDPLGFVNPVVVKAKILLQRLWLLKLDWDAALPLEIQTDWIKFRKELNRLKELKIPRHVITTDLSTQIQFHGFSDASEKAYAAVIYVRSVDTQGLISVHLLCAKSRVAPIKKQTLPRLELCAAKLLAQLTSQVVKSTQSSPSQLFFWTDSSIVLSWIRSDSSSFKTFVANRIATIHELSDPKQWRHVKGEQNPADLGSRGASPAKLCSSQIWFNGPDFLKKPESEWPNERIIKLADCTEKRERKSTVMTTTTKSSVIFNINHRNSFTFLQRTTAYVLRFIHNCQTKSCDKPRLSGPLKVDELQGGLNVIIKDIQMSYFLEDLKHLRKKGFVESRSRLVGLTPFIDETGIIRVGGRLQASNLKYNAKHPIILPHSHIITRLLLEHLHVKYLHAGPQALLAYTRQQFWPLRGKVLAKSIVHKCVRCARFKPKNINQLMGNLPSERIQPTRPFTYVGVDFCGPVHIHYKLRGKRPTKAYIAVFICFTTKAVHLEVVSDLTTAAFIASLKRFIGRRGKPSKIFCDNATNFVGAKNELREIRGLIHRDERTIIDHCAKEEIQWSPIPPRSPHFGGLWESAVKSTKYHLVRVLMGTSPTYEELCTVIVEIEAILNSRPLTPLSDNPNDMQALTPGHFLIGEPLTSLNHPEAQLKGETLSKRWKIVQTIQQEFWKRWSREYLQELQYRNKWRTSGMPIKPGMIVLLKEDNLPPLKWQLARVTKEYKGKDGLTRVVDVKTAKGTTVTRAITKICPLPVETSDDEQGTTTARQTTIIAIPQGNNSRGFNLSLQQYQDGSTSLKKRPISSATSTTKPLPVVRQPQLRSKKRKIAPINPAWLNSPHLNKRCSALEKYYKPPEPQPDVQPANKGRRKNTMAHSMLSLLLIVNMVLPAFSQTSKSAFQITPFASNTGIYFEGLGHVQMITDEWNIIAYYNLEGYWKELNGLRKCLKQLTTLCDSLKTYEEYCSIVSAQLKHQLVDIEHGNEVLLKFNDPSSNTRTKRSPLDIIGSISNKLFGILDQDYAERMTQTIQTIESNEAHLLDLLKNQTSVIDSTVNIMKKSEKLIHRQFLHINSYLGELSAAIGNITERINQQRIMQIFNSLSIYTTLIIMGYERIQTALIEVFADTRTGHLNPLLVTPQQLRQELNLIRENLPSSISLPEQLLSKDDATNLYTLITVQARITEQHAIFSIKIPLVNHEIFEIFHIVPVPITVGTSTLIIQKVAEFLVVNLLHDHYYPMTSFDFTNCWKGSLENYICRQHGTIYHKTIGQHQCELELLNQKGRLPSSCHLSVTNERNNWIQLHNSNQWIYSFSTQVAVNIVCGKSSFREELEGQGLLVFKTNCVLRENMITISSHNQQPNLIQSSFASSMPINTTAFEVQQQPYNKSNRRISELPPLNTTKEFQHLQEMIRQIKAEEHISSISNVKAINIHHFSIAYLALAVAASILIYFIIIKIRKHRPAKPKRSTESNQPQPAPRRIFEFHP